MRNHVRLGITAAASPLEVGADDALTLLGHLRGAFAAWGFDRLELCSFGQPVTDPTSAVEAGRTFYDQRVDAVCVVAASWFEDYLILDLLEECDVPVIAWARPGMETGSLCGMQQLGFMLRQLGRSYEFLFYEVDSEVALRRAYDFAMAAALRHRLRRARIGTLGHRVEGMTETTAHELALKSVFGPRVVGMDSQSFMGRARSIPSERVAERWECLKGEVGRLAVTDEVGIESLQVHAALQDAIGEGGLSAVAVGCYPDLMGRVCLAASLLGEQGIPVACEGDVNGALAMLMLTWLAQQPTHHTDLLDPIPDDHTIVFSHCGSGGFSLAQERGQITFAPVRLMDQGLCCRFPAKPGPVTLINIVPSMAGYQMALLLGTAVETEMVFPGNPLRVRFESSYHDVLSWIAAEGIGHHWVAAYGDWRAQLSHLVDMVGCPLVAMA